MFRITRFVISVAIAAFLVAACAQAAPSTNSKTVVVTPAIKGNSASLNVGDKLEIQLPTIPSEGYSWVPQDLDTSILVQEGEAVYTADSNPNSAGGVVTLRFNAVGKGTTALTLAYENSPADGSPGFSTDSFSLAVEVK